MNDKQLIAEAEQRVVEIIPLLVHIDPSKNEPVVEGKFQALFSTLVKRDLTGKDDSEIKRTFVRVCLTTKLLAALREVYGVNGHSMSSRLHESEDNFRSAYNIIQQDGDVFGPNTKAVYNVLVQTAVRTIGWTDPHYHLPKFII
ncbi:MAG: hypothetical protein Q7R77_02705 [Candidatus Daviesbacteria bacterium]|nr:hypothetical protein [Candidatus Daviesbacteria bacterium]